MTGCCGVASPALLPLGSGWFIILGFGASLFIANDDDAVGDDGWLGVSLDVGLGPSVAGAAGLSGPVLDV